MAVTRMCFVSYVPTCCRVLKLFHVFPLFYQLVGRVYNYLGFAALVILCVDSCKAEGSLFVVPEAARFASLREE